MESLMLWELNSRGCSERLVVLELDCGWNPAGNPGIGRPAEARTGGGSGGFFDSVEYAAKY